MLTEDLRKMNDVELHEDYATPSAFSVIKEGERYGCGIWHECGR